MTSMIRLIARFLLAMPVYAFLLMPQYAWAQNSYANSTDGVISETATPCATPLVRTFLVPGHFTIADVNLGVLLAHTYRGDLRFTLRSPVGTSIALMTNIGTSQDNLNILFDDSAAASITTHTSANDTATATTVTPPFQRTYRPQTALTGFNGQDAFGTWTLEICDSLNVDSGTFYHSVLTLTPSPATINVAKSSSTVSDGINTTNPKSIPGARMRYCILVTNAGSGIASDIAATDTMPANVTFVAGSMRSGASCATATTVEDDNASGTDESDPLGASIAGAIVTFTSATMASGTTIALTFEAIVN